MKLMIELTAFYNDVLCKKRFYMPVVFFSIVAYSFSIYNRTVGVDDFTRDINIGSGNRMLAGRWGMVVWNKLVGITVALDPFIDRFLALMFLLMAAALFCYILYSVGRNKEVFPYTIVASAFVTYPLLNSIWEYTGADYMVTGNICLVTLAAIAVMRIIPFWKKMLFASILLLLPISSYETAIFYYVSLVCIIVFFEYVIEDKVECTFYRWIKTNFTYFIPLFIAFIARFSISFVINTIFDLQYSSGGSTSIAWLNNGFLHTLKCLFAFNLVKYILTGFVYFPIFIFVMSLIVFIGCVLLYKGEHFKSIILGAILFFSLYSQSFLQGMELEYRNAQTVSLFVAFSFYFLCISITNGRIKKIVYFALLALCWHQAVYLNRILGLNNLRSDNEVALIHQIGKGLTGFEKKPVAFVGYYQPSDYITNQISVDDSSWNGRLFYSIYDRFIAKLKRPYQYGANVNSAFGYYQFRECFRYFGYDVDVVLPSELAKLDTYPKKYVQSGDRILQNAASLVKEKGIRPYQVYDAGNYLVVYLGGDL